MDLKKEWNVKRFQIRRSENAPVIAAWIKEVLHTTKVQDFCSIWVQKVHKL